MINRVLATALPRQHAIYTQPKVFELNWARISPQSWFGLNKITIQLVGQPEVESCTREKLNLIEVSAVIRLTAGYT